MDFFFIFQPECTSGSQVKDILNLESLEAGYVIFNQILLNAGRFDLNEIHILDIAAKAIYGLGELGLFTLEY